MFKVGDKGKTRGGFNYEVISTNAHYQHGDEVQHIETKIAGDGGYYHCNDGAFSRYQYPGDLDLMPPDSNHYNTGDECSPDKEEVEMPECNPDNCAHNFDMAELVQIAAQAARDNPDLTVTLDPEIRAIHFHA